MVCSILEPGAIFGARSCCPLFFLLFRSSSCFALHLSLYASRRSSETPTFSLLAPLLFTTSECKLVEPLLLGLVSLLVLAAVHSSPFLLPPRPPLSPPRFRTKNTNVSKEIWNQVRSNVSSLATSSRADPRAVHIRATGRCRGEVRYRSSVFSGGNRPFAPGHETKASKGGKCGVSPAGKKVAACCNIEGSLDWPSSSIVCARAILVPLVQFAQRGGACHRGTSRSTATRCISLASGAY